MEDMDVLVKMRRVMGLKGWIKEICLSRKERHVADCDYDNACIWRDYLTSWLGAMAS